LWGEGFFGDNKYLGHMWAAAQTELLAYRRLYDRDPWTSESFDMDALLKRLEVGIELNIGLVKEGVMKAYCSCGSFTKCPWPGVRGGDQVTASIFQSSKYNFGGNAETGADI
jgi:hypothetical protein